MCEETVSRVLYASKRAAVIYLGGPLPTRSMPPPGERPGRPCVPRTTVLLRIEFTGTDASTPSRGLLPHVSTLAPPPNRAAGRFISVALFLESPPAAVSRYPCPVQPGLSSHAPFRALCATALFPHGGILPFPGIPVKEWIEFPQQHNNMSTAGNEYSLYRDAPRRAGLGKGPSRTEIFTISPKLSTMDIQKIPWISTNRST